MQKGIDHIGIAIVPFLHNGKGKYLVGLRTEKARDERGRWDALGPGGLEFGETIEQGILREVEEETGARPFNIEYLGYREVFGNAEGERTHWLSFDFRAQVNPDDVRVTEPEKCAEIRWCALEDIPEPRHSQFPVFLEKYKDFL